MSKEKTQLSQNRKCMTDRIKMNKKNEIINDCLPLLTGHVCPKGFQWIHHGTVENQCLNHVFVVIQCLS